MSIFWVIGIAINVTFFALAAYWISKQWKLASKKPDDSGPDEHK